MIIQGNKKFIEAEFENEQEIEDVVIENAEYFFGASSIFLPKKLIKTKDGFGTIPDGFAIDLASRNWYVIEVELVHHSVWSHIAPQVAKQMIAVATPESRQILEEMVIQMFTESDDIKDKFKEEKIEEIDVRKVIRDILGNSPVIGMPIDKISRDLKEWAETLRNDVKLWLVKKYVEFGIPENIAYEIPEEYRPVLDTIEEKNEPKSGITYYDVSLADLIEADLLNEGDELVMDYKPRGGSHKKYRAIVTENGNLNVLGKKFKSPSYAAIFGINDAGSNRKTVNGWTSWKNRNGKLLSDLRSDYLKQKESEVE
ncbi:MAG: hypothetical protein J7K65_04435 [Planctomycetes bacterium]|nr:hypothetical protein [Planctomycetota bacterium]